VSLQKLHQLSWQLFVKLLGRAGDAQRRSKRGVIILLIGLQWLLTTLIRISSSLTRDKAIITIRCASSGINS